MGRKVIVGFTAEDRWTPEQLADIMILFNKLSKAVERKKTMKSDSRIQINQGVNRVMLPFKNWDYDENRARPNSKRGGKYSRRHKNGRGTARTIGALDFQRAEATAERAKAHSRAERENELRWAA